MKIAGLVSELQSVVALSIPRSARSRGAGLVAFLIMRSRRLPPGSRVHEVDDRADPPPVFHPADLERAGYFANPVKSSDVRGAEVQHRRNLIYVDDAIAIDEGGKGYGRLLGAGLQASHLNVSFCPAGQSEFSIPALRFGRFGQIGRFGPVSLRKRVPVGRQKQYVTQSCARQVQREA